jgi:hypothetical protein
MEGLLSIESGPIDPGIRYAGSSVNSGTCSKKRGSGCCKIADSVHCDTCVGPMWRSRRYHAIQEYLDALQQRQQLSILPSLFGTGRRGNIMLDAGILCPTWIHKHLLQYESLFLLFVGGPLRYAGEPTQETTIVASHSSAHCRLSLGYLSTPMISGAAIFSYHPW